MKKRQPVLAWQSDWHISGDPTWVQIGFVKSFVILLFPIPAVWSKVNFNHLGNHGIWQTPSMVLNARFPTGRVRPCAQVLIRALVGVLEGALARFLIEALVEAISAWTKVGPKNTSRPQESGEEEQQALVMMIVIVKMTMTMVMVVMRMVRWRAPSTAPSHSCVTNSKADSGLRSLSWRLDRTEN